MTDVERPERFDMSDTDRREDGLAAAALAVRRGELVILPTDTVYGIGCDAFDPAAVQRLLDAKGRGREMPPPVLVSTLTTLDALADEVPEWARLLTDAFWPGPLTLVLHQQSSLQWDLGDTRGTVALRMPEHEIALDLIQRTGPLAVSSANTTGLPAAEDADTAIGMLGDEVVAVLDSGRVEGGTASTIVDCTGHTPRVLREGALATSRIREVLAEHGHWLDEDEDWFVDDDVVEDEHGLPGSPTPDADIVDADVVEGEVVEPPAAGRHRAPDALGELPPLPPVPPASSPSATSSKHAMASTDEAEVDLVEKTAAKKAPVKKAAVKKTAAKKATVKKTAAKKTAVKKTAVKKTAVKKTTAKKTAAKKTTAKKTAAKKTTAKKTAAKKAPAKRAPAKKTTGGSGTGA